jgi:hypothetical protein
MSIFGDILEKLSLRKSPKGVAADIISAAAQTTQFAPPRSAGDKFVGDTARSLNSSQPSRPTRQIIVTSPGGIAP